MIRVSSSSRSWLGLIVYTVKVCESDPNPSSNPIQSDPIGFGSDSDSNSLGSDRISFFYCRIGSDFVRFVSDRIRGFS